MTIILIVYFACAYDLYGEYSMHSSQTVVLDLWRFISVYGNLHFWIHLLFLRDIHGNKTCIYDILN